MTTLEPPAIMKPSARELIPLRVKGIFPQRQEDAFMARVRIPCGLLTPAQLDAVADATDRFAANGRAHFTMRQDIQLYETRLEDRPALDALLHTAHLSLRESGGNVVRNVTCCPHAGLTAAAFDPTPFALALANHFHNRSDVLCTRENRPITANSLPRKLKFAVGGCCDGACGNTAINDLGFLAATCDNVPGFRVTIAGGLSAKPRIAETLYDFIPAADLLTVAEAVVRIFAEHGTLDPSHKRSSRLRHLVAKMGLPWMRDQIDRLLARMPAVPMQLSPSPCIPPATPAPFPPTNDATFDAWAASHVRATTIADTFSCHAANLYNDLSPTHLRTLAALARNFSNADMRLTLEQGLLFRRVARDNIRPLFTALREANLIPAAPGASLTACPGLASCRYAIADTRAISARIDAWLAANAATLADAGPIRIRVSGCPFSCGHHHVGTIGFYGTARTIAVAGRIRPVPLAALVLGGALSADTSHIAAPIIGIPPRKIPAALDRLLSLYRAARTPNQPFADWSLSADPDLLRSHLADLSTLDPHDPDLALDLDKAR